MFLVQNAHASVIVLVQTSVFYSTLTNFIPGFLSGSASPQHQTQNFIRGLLVWFHKMDLEGFVGSKFRA